MAIQALIYPELKAMWERETREMYGKPSLWSRYSAWGSVVRWVERWIRGQSTKDDMLYVVIVLLTSQTPLAGLENDSGR